MLCRLSASADVPERVLLQDLGPAVVVGRASQCGVLLDADEAKAAVSKRHARLRVTTDGSLEVERYGLSPGASLCTRQDVENGAALNLGGSARQVSLRMARYMPIGSEGQGEGALPCMVLPSGSVYLMACAVDTIASRPACSTAAA